MPGAVVLGDCLCSLLREVAVGEFLLVSSLISSTLDHLVVKGSPSKPTQMFSVSDPGEKEGLGLSADDFCH